MNLHFIFEYDFFCDKSYMNIASLFNTPSPELGAWFHQGEKSRSLPSDEVTSSTNSWGRALRCFLQAPGPQQGYGISILIGPAHGRQMYRHFTEEKLQLKLNTAARDRCIDKLPTNFHAPWSTGLVVLLNLKTVSFLWKEVLFCFAVESG